MTALWVHAVEYSPALKKQVSNTVSRILKLSCTEMFRGFSESGYYILMLPYPYPLFFLDFDKSSFTIKYPHKTPKKYTVTYYLLICCICHRKPLSTLIVCYSFLWFRRRMTVCRLSIRYQENVGTKARKIIHKK